MERKLIEEFDKKQKSNKHKRNKESNHASNSKTKQAKIVVPDPIQSSTSYRDRARERREGLNTDFELDPDDLRISNPIIENNPLDSSEQTIDEEELRRQQIEDSKYLGGDVEHTHLVKGLDFALLEKVKNDQKLAEKLACDKEVNRDLLGIGDPDSDSEEEEFKNEAILAASSSSNSKRQLVDIEKLKKGQSTEIISCRTALARRILNVLDEKWPEKSELFLPGRMSYIIPVDEECEEGTVTTVLRSKADASTTDESGPLNESNFALDQLINILAKLRRGETNTDTTKKAKSWERDDETNAYGY